MEFYKMHGCGNDFCLVDYQDGIDYPSLARRLCNRRFGAGADWLIVVKSAPLEMMLFDLNGARVAMSGDGIRCFARYAYEKKWLDTMQFECLTLAGKIKGNITSISPFLCRIDMGCPMYNNQMIYVSDDVNSFGRLLRVDEYHLTIYSFFFGAVHTVVFVDSLNSSVLDKAQAISTHRLFRKQTHVSFIELVDEKHIKIKTYEKGIGFATSCGTAACACAITCYRLKLTKHRVEVIQPMGSLTIEIGKKEKVYMEGPAVLTYIGNTSEVEEC